MRKQFLFIILALIGFNRISAQTRGNKVGYIDMEYILEKVPDYTEAKTQLEEKAQKWKQEIEEKKTAINKLSEALKIEKPLLTAELIEERQTEIKFLETEKLDYQQKRFGPNGDLMIQKASLTKPVQDRVFTIVQDIAEAKKYDFIFDKSSHLTILFASKRFDISDQVIRALNRSEKKEKLTKKQQKEEDEKDSKEDALIENPALAEREQALLDKKAARDKIIADRKLEQEEIRKQYEEKRQKIIAERAAKKSGVGTTTTKTISDSTAVANPKNEAEKITQENKKTELEERKKTLDEKRNKIIEEREAIKKALEEKKAKELEERAATKKALEEKKAKELEDRAALKKENEEKLKSKNNTNTN